MHSTGYDRRAAARDHLFAFGLTEAEIIGDARDQIPHDPRLVRAKP